MFTLATRPALAALGFALLTLAPGAAFSAEKNEGFSAGLNVQPRATLTDIGLPGYPGATPDKDDRDDSEGATIQLWGGLFGMQLHVVKLRSNEGPEAVARFYRDAMARQGPLVDCTPAGAAAEPPAAPASQPKLLRCDKDRAKAGGYLYKVGLPGGVRMVSVEPAGRGSRIQLVRLMIKGE